MRDIAASEDEAGKACGAKQHSDHDVAVDNFGRLTGPRYCLSEDESWRNMKAVYNKTLTFVRLWT